MSITTTIKLQKKTKSELDQIKSESESYDSAIKRLISSTKNKNLKAELVEAYKSMGQRELDILDEWDLASNELNHD